MQQEKLTLQAELFSNRLAKRYRHLKKWARKNRTTCYRIYDKDIPEIPIACDLYTFLPSDIDDKLSAIQLYNEVSSAISSNSKNAPALIEDELRRTYLTLYLYERPYKKSSEEEDIWLKEMSIKAAGTIGIEPSNVIIKTRRHQGLNEEGVKSQYEKIRNTSSICGTIFEQGQLFYINLSDYIDSGLFLDHRILRSTIRTICERKSVLNLFCYTGSFSVYAAEGRASFVESVDMSHTYIEWAKKNMELNGFTDPDKYKYTRCDAVEFIKTGAKRKYDIIILDPPTFSNSKKTESTLDINRDWLNLISDSFNLLTLGGTLYFSTNSRRLKFEENLIKDKFKCSILDISEKTISEDYRNAKIHRVWEIKKL